MTLSNRRGSQRKPQALGGLLDAGRITSSELLQATMALSVEINSFLAFFSR